MPWNHPPPPGGLREVASKRGRRAEKRWTGGARLHHPPQSRVPCLRRPCAVGTVQDAAGQCGGRLPLGPGRSVSAPGAGPRCPGRIQQPGRATGPGVSRAAQPTGTQKVARRCRAEGRRGNCSLREVAREGRGRAGRRSSLRPRKVGVF